MNISYPAGAEEFRLSVRAFLREQLPAGWTGLGALPAGERAAFQKRWREVLAANGMLAVSWPEEYGGSGLSEVEQVVLAEELAGAGAPEGGENDSFGIRLLGNTLIAHGDQYQQSYFLPRILTGEHVWCQGFSEPDAGSDLAGIRTRATPEDGEWVINGQKIWTSAGASANWIFLLARTDWEAPKHRGLTFLLVPMGQPGVEVRPIVNAAGYALFNEVFFTGARTRAEHAVGPVNQGWSVAMTLLGFERGARVTTDAIRFRRDLDRLLELARERGRASDPLIRDRLAWCFSRAEIMRYRGYQALTKFLSGQRPAAEAAITKVIWSEYFQRYTELALDILGLDAIAPGGGGNGGALQVPEAGTPNTPARWVDEYLHARAATIYAGTSQIQRTVIGEQLLGLAREPRADGGPFRSIAAGPDMPAAAPRR